MYNQDYIKETWHRLSIESNSLDYILPNRTEEEFWDEGRSQAYEIQQHIRPEYKVLEFGCGVGRILTNIKATEKHGADASSEYLSKIKSNDIIKHHSDGLNLIHRNDYFDFIYSIMVFQHIPKNYHKDIFINLFKCLKPNGKLFIQFPQNPNSYYKETEFVNLFTHNEIVSNLRATGYNRIKVKGGNLVGYGQNGEYKPVEKLEYFASARKPIEKK